MQDSMHSRGNRDRVRRRVRYRSAEATGSRSLIAVCLLGTLLVGASCDEASPSRASPTRVSLTRTDEPPSPQLPADLAIELSSERTSYAVGEYFDLVATVTNRGPGDASGVSASVPVNTDFLVRAELVVADPASVRCFFAPNTQRADCRMATLASGGSFRMSMAVGALSAGTKTHTADVASDAPPDPDPSDNQATLVTRIDE